MSEPIEKRSLHMILLWSQVEGGAAFRTFIPAPTSFSDMTKTALLLLLAVRGKVSVHSEEAVPGARVSFLARSSNDKWRCFYQSMDLRNMMPMQRRVFASIQQTHTMRFPELGCSATKYYEPLSVAGKQRLYQSTTPPQKYMARPTRKRHTTLFRVRGCHSPCGGIIEL